MLPIRRGDIRWVSFDFASGGEIRKTRPAVIVSNNAANSVLNRVVVIPLTSKTQRLYPGQALVTVGGREAKAMADQITTASTDRLGEHISALSSNDLQKVEDAILLHLAIRR
jgi:mRNA interferase MazF